MPGGLWTRLKTWIDNENVTYSDLNAEFDNIIANDKPEKSDDYSLTTNQMQIQTSPGSQGSESLATTLAGELERLRYVISRIIGQTYWYDTPARSLQTGSVETVFHQSFDGDDLTDVYGKCMTRGMIPTAHASAQIQGANVFSTGSVAKFGKYALNIGPDILGGDTIFAVRGGGSSRTEGSLSLHFYNYGVNDYIAYNPQLGLEVYLDSQGRLNYKQTLASAATESTKNTKTIVGTNVLSGAASWKHLMLKYQANGIAGSGTDAVDMKVDGTAEGTQLSAQTMPINVGDGGTWFFGARRKDPAWSHFYAASGLPSAHSAPWTLVGDATCWAVFNNVLTFNSKSAAAGVSSFKKDGVNMFDGNSNGGTLEIKIQVFEAYEGAASDDLSMVSGSFDIIMRDGVNTSCFIHFRPDRIVLDDGGAMTHTKTIYIDNTSWHVYRFVMIGQQTVRVYVDGVYMGYLTCGSVADANVATLKFGDYQGSGTGGGCTANIEYLAYTTAYSYEPISAGVQGYMDEIVLLGNYLSDSAIDTSLKTTRVRDLFGKDFTARIRDKVLQWAPTHVTPYYVDKTGSTKWQGALSSVGFPEFWSDGITPVKIEVEGSLGNDTAGILTSLMLAILGNSTQGVDLGGNTVATSLHSGSSVRKAAGSAGFRQSFYLATKAVLLPGVYTADIFVQTSNAANNARLYLEDLRVRVSYDR
jgi:hypothetical protein